MPRYNPFVPPLNPNVLNDEFTTDLSDWTLYNHGDNTVAQIVNNRLQLSQSNSDGELVGGIIKELPVGDFTIETYVSASMLYSDVSGHYAAFGMMVLENETDTGRFLSWDIVLPFSVAFPYLIADKYTAYNANNPGARVLETLIWRDINGLFMRMRREGTNYYGDISLKGAGWKQMWVTTIPYVATQMGLFIDFVDYVPTNYVEVPFFRYTDSSLSVNESIGGQRIN